MSKAVAAAGLACILPFALTLQSTAVGPDESWTIQKIFYGDGWMDDPTTKVRQWVAFLNLTESYERRFPDNGTFEAFSQIFIEFSIPMNASGPANGSALRIRFSYYVAARCLDLDSLTCPLGSNTTAITQDIFELEVRRIIEYRDANGSGAYEPGEDVANDVPLARPDSPHVRAWPFALDGSAMDLPYDWNISTDDANLRIGALFAGDPLLEDLSDFWISAGNGIPTNLTLNSFFFLRPTTYKAVPLTPTMLKLDIHLGHVFYLQDDTAPALECVLTSRQFRLIANETGSNQSLFTNASAARAFFTWSANATVDGNEAPVRATIAASNESTIVYLSYPRGASILHDPVVGLALGPGDAEAPLSNRPPAGSGGPTWIPVLLAAMGLVAVVAAYVLLRRRRP